MHKLGKLLGKGQTSESTFYSGTTFKYSKMLPKIVAKCVANSCEHLTDESLANFLINCRQKVANQFPKVGSREETGGNILAAQEMLTSCKDRFFDLIEVAMQRALKLLAGRKEVEKRNLTMSSC